MATSPEKLSAKEAAAQAAAAAAAAVAAVRQKRATESSPQDAERPAKRARGSGSASSKGGTGSASSKGSPSRPVDDASGTPSKRSATDYAVGGGLRIPGVPWRALHHHQREGVQWLWQRHREKGGGILADEMGLGKTAQIVVYLAALHHSGILQKMRVVNTSTETSRDPKPGGILIVCPATLIAQWRAEFSAWYPTLKVSVMHRADAREEHLRNEAIWNACQEQHVLLTSYDVFRAKCDDVLDANWVIAILDEGQRIHCPDATATLAVKKLSTPHRLLLTGCPIQGKLPELWSVVDFVAPGLLGTLPVFQAELAHPIEMGSAAGANQVQAATAYQCARALRNLTAPCILRRMKAEVMEELKLPGKQEQVLFCNPTTEQYVAYMECLQSRHGQKAAARKGKLKESRSSFAVIAMLRKICNHPDLIAPDTDSTNGFGDVLRSGKATVLVDLVDTWKKEGNRVLIFVENSYIMELISRWFDEKGLYHLQIHTKTPVGDRLDLIKRYNTDTRIFAMLLTNRIGGVGLNIVGANRVVVFDPDWNPMTSVRARERVWRIGQRKDVEIYRLVLVGTIEEKIYRRQVNKQVLSQKVLDDPRQQMFKQRAVANLFELPAQPPNLDPKKFAKLKAKYKAFFENIADKDVEVHEDDPVSSQMLEGSANSDLPDCLKKLFVKQGIKGSVDCAQVERGRLSRSIAEGSNQIALKAVEALKKSMRERASHDISTPTWTGKSGRAGASLSTLKAAGKAAAGKAVAAKYEASLSSSKKRQPLRPPPPKVKGQAASASSRSQKGHPAASSQPSPPSQPRQPRQPGTPPPAAGRESLSAQVAEAMKRFSLARARTGLVTAPLPAGEQDVVEIILRAFLDPELSGDKHLLSTGGVLEHVAPRIPFQRANRLKHFLSELCVFSKTGDGTPGVWSLRQAFWPTKPGSGA